MSVLIKELVSQAFHLNASLHGLRHRLPGDDARSLQANPEPLAGAKGTLAVNRVSKSVNDPAEALHADRDVDDGTSPLDDIALEVHCKHLIKSKINYYIYI